MNRMFVAAHLEPQGALVDVSLTRKELVQAVFANPKRRLFFRCSRA